MTLVATKKIIEYDAYELKIHMNQCKKENRLEQSIHKALNITYDFFTGKIITILIVMAIVTGCISIII